MAVTWHGVTSVRYGSADPIPVPFIPQTRGSWYPKPDMVLRTQRYNDPKTFGRGTDGHQAATQWLHSYLTDIMESHGWAIPDQVTYGAQTRVGSQHRATGLTLGFNWGEESSRHIVEVGLHEARYSDGPSFVYQLPWYLYDVLARDLTYNNSPSRNTKVELHQRYQAQYRDSYAPVRDLLQEFWQDPWNMAYGYATDQGKAVMNIIGDPGEFRRTSDELPYVDPYGDDTILFIPSEMQRYMPDFNERIVTTDEWNTLEAAVRKFKDLGVKVKLTSRESADGDVEVTGITIETPMLDARYKETDPWNELADKERGILERHKISLGIEGVTVHCGYLTSEERFERYRARQMKAFIDEMTEGSDVGEVETEVLNW